jgi:hypothetical protein
VCEKKKPSEKREGRSVQGVEKTRNNVRREVRGGEQNFIL